MQESSENTLTKAISQLSFEDVQQDLTQWDDLSDSEKTFYILKSGDKNLFFEFFGQYSLPLVSKFSD